jgi:hypothetical protein
MIFVADGLKEHTPETVRTVGGPVNCRTTNVKVKVSKVQPLQGEEYLQLGLQFSAFPVHIILLDYIT